MCREIGKPGNFLSLRPGSDAVLHMSRIKFKFMWSTAVWINWKRPDTLYSKTAANLVFFFFTRKLAPDAQFKRKYSFFNFPTAFRRQQITPKTITNCTPDPRTKRLGQRARSPLPPLTMLIIGWFFLFCWKKRDIFQQWLGGIGDTWSGSTVPTTFKVSNGGPINKAIPVWINRCLYKIRT